MRLPFYAKGLPVYGTLGFVFRGPPAGSGALRPLPVPRDSNSFAGSG